MKNIRFNRESVETQNKVLNEIFRLHKELTKFPPCKETTDAQYKALTALKDWKCKDSNMQQDLIKFRYYLEVCIQEAEWVTEE